MPYQSVMETMVTRTLGLNPILPVSKHHSFWKSYQQVVLAPEVRLDQRYGLELWLWKRYFNDNFPGVPPCVQPVSNFHEREETVQIWERRKSLSVPLSQRKHLEVIQLHDDELHFRPSFCHRSDSGDDTSFKFIINDSTGQLAIKWKLPPEVGKPWEESTGWTTSTWTEGFESLDERPQTPDTSDTPPRSRRKRSLVITAREWKTNEPVRKRRGVKRPIREPFMPANEHWGLIWGSYLPKSFISMNPGLGTIQPSKVLKKEPLYESTLPKPRPQRLVPNGIPFVYLDKDTFDATMDLTMNLNEPWHMGIDDAPLMRHYTSVTKDMPKQPNKKVRFELPDVPF